MRDAQPLGSIDTTLNGAINVEKDPQIGQRSADGGAAENERLETESDVKAVNTVPEDDKPETGGQFTPREYQRVVSVVIVYCSTS